MSELTDLIAEVNALKKKVEELYCRPYLGWTGMSINFGTPTELTIAGGIITKTGSYHLVDTAAHAGTDDLDTINGGVTGDLLVLSSVSSARVVTLKDGTGNMKLPADMILDNPEDIEILMYNGTNWLEWTGSSNI